MNVNEISYMYNSALNGLSVEGAPGVSSKQIEAAKEALNKAGVNGFSASLNEEVSKLTDEERAKAIEFRELAGALDHSVLGNMVEGASDKDLALMSEEMLGSSKGREVLSKLMEGHFNSMVLGNTDKDDDDEEIDSSLNTDSYLRGTYEG